MIRTETITSAQNPRIKELVQLQEKSRARREKGLFVVEGRREFSHCLQAGFKARSLFVCPEILGQEDYRSLEEIGCPINEIPAFLYEKIAYRGGTAIVMGTEATGLTPIWRQAADAHIMIPMLGRLDSLNVSVSAAILLYEAVRQRQAK